MAVLDFLAMLRPGDGAVTRFAAPRSRAGRSGICSRNIEELVIWQLWLNRFMYFIRPVHAVWCTRPDRGAGPYFWVPPCYSSTVVCSIARARVCRGQSREIGCRTGTKNTGREPRPVAVRGGTPTEPSSSAAAVGLGLNRYNMPMRRVGPRIRLCGRYGRGSSDILHSSR